MAKLTSRSDYPKYKHTDKLSLSEVEVKLANSKFELEQVQKKFDQHFTGNAFIIFKSSHVA